MRNTILIIIISFFPVNYSLYADNPIAKQQPVPKDNPKIIKNIKAIYMPKIEYPALVKNAGVEGTIFLMIRINEDGRVDHSKFVRSKLFKNGREITDEKLEKILVENSVNSIKKAIYRVEFVENKSQPVSIIQPVRYKFEDNPYANKGWQHKRKIDKKFYEVQGLFNISITFKLSIASDIIVHDKSHQHKYMDKIYQSLQGLMIDLPLFSNLFLSGGFGQTSYITMKFVDDYLFFYDSANFAPFVNIGFRYFFLGDVFQIDADRYQSIGMFIGFHYQWSKFSNDYIKNRVDGYIYELGLRVNINTLYTDMFLNLESLHVGNKKIKEFGMNFALGKSFHF